MRWSVDGVHVGAVLGIPLFIQNSVFAAAPLVMFFAVMAGSTRELAINLVVLPLFISSIVVHELAHARVASLFGMPVRHITLTWFGGFAEFWLKPTSRWREALIAVSGPVSNLALAGIAFALLALFGEQQGYLESWEGGMHWRWPDPQYRAPIVQEIASRFAWFNLALGVFSIFFRASLLMADTSCARV